MSKSTRRDCENTASKFAPDIIIHEPFDLARHGARMEGNRAVVELKVNATAAQAAEDFESLAAIIHALRDPLGVFVNIASSVTLYRLSGSHR